MMHTCDEGYFAVEQVGAEGRREVDWGFCVAGHVVVVGCGEAVS